MNDTNYIKVLIAGDYCPNYRVKHLIEKDQGDSIFSDIQEIVQNADVSVVNFECSVETANSEKITKHGESLKCSAKSVELLKKVGFDIVTLANNHFYDYGDSGVKSTLRCLNENQIDYVGGGENLCEASRILYRSVKGKKIAFINCCENEFSIATNNHGGSNPLHPIKQFYDIQEAKKNANAVIVIVHGGHEHYQYPSLRMKETYRFFVDAGADVVVNGHQHCYSGYEVYKEKPIFYGLGNFCFDWKVNDLKPWHWGYMVELNIDVDQQISFFLHPYIQCYKSPLIELLETGQLQDFYAKIQEINNVIADDNKLLAKFNSFVNRETLYYTVDLEPYSSRLMRGLYTRRLLPSLIGRNKMQQIYNHIICESHYDIFSNILKRNK